MNSSQALENRLQTIGHVLASDPDGLALLGLGSVGLELSRLDAWSDLDFFAIVRPGSKPRFLQDLGWLHRVHPVVYPFRNTPDGFKLLFEDIPARAEAGHHSVVKVQAQRSRRAPFGGAHADPVSQMVQ